MQTTALIRLLYTMVRYDFWETFWVLGIIVCPGVGGFKGEGLNKNSFLKTSSSLASSELQGTQLSVVYTKLLGNIFYGF